MQPQSSTAPAPLPQPAAPQPVVVKPRHAPPSRFGWWVAGILLVAAVVAGTLYWRRQATQDATSAAVRTVRTARVSTGVMQSTLRLTGTTAAENFASMVVPQLRGSRGDFGRDRGSVSSASAPPSLAAAPSNIGPTGSASGGSSSLSSALRSSTSRVGGTTASKSSTGGEATASSGSMGSSGLGSTAGSLQGGGGGGGGGDFAIVLQKLVKPGTRVKKGEVVAELDRQNMLNRLDDYRASVAQTEASLLKLKADLSIIRHAHRQSIVRAQAALDKANLDLKTLPVLSSIDAERARLAMELHQARLKELQSETKLVETSLGSQIRGAEISLQQTNIEFKRAEANAERMIIKAPIDGLTVMSTVPIGGELRQIKEGDQLYAGTLFMSLVDTRSMVITSSVNQADVEKLRLGLKATVRFDAYPDLVLQAHVYSVGGIAKPGGQRATFVKEIPVRLKLDTMDPRVIPDLSVSADVVIETESRATAIAPLAAVARDASSGAYVMVQGASGWVRRAVELGVADYINVAVRSGLKENEVVAMERPAEPATQAAAP